MTRVLSHTRRVPRVLAATGLACTLAACSVLGEPRQPTTIFAPVPRATIDAAWPTVDFQLAVSTPDVARGVDSQRIAVRPSPLELQVYKDAAWSRRPSDMVEDVVLRTLEDSGRIRAVARQGSGIAADYKLVMEIRRFESDYAGAAVPKATLEVSAKLLHSTDQTVVAGRVFTQQVSASSTATADVAAAFERALAAFGADIAGWVLTTGHAHGLTHEARPDAAPRVTRGSDGTSG